MNLLEISGVVLLVSAYATGRTTRASASHVMVGPGFAAYSVRF